MKISIALILDELGLDTENYIGGGLNPEFSSVELYVPGELYTQGQLLICSLSEAINVAERDGLYFLCVRDRIADERETPEALDGIVLIKRNIDMRILVNRVQRIFVKIMDWVLAMERSTSKRGGPQELLDLSEPIFRNFITVQDSTFKLLAYTKNIEITDRIMNRLLEYGYHPNETMNLFRIHRRIEQFRTEAGVIVDRDRLTSDYDVVKKTFHAAGDVFLILVMVCNNRPATGALVELFEILAGYIRSYIDLEITRMGGMGGISTLALDLMNRTVASREEAKIRAAYCGYPFDGSFRLHLFSFEDEANLPPARLARSLSETCPGCAAVPLNKDILLITNEPRDIDGLYTRIKSIIPFANFKCGISNRFTCLWDLPVAYNQARIAVDISSRLKPETLDTSKAHPQFSHFAEHFIHHIVYEGYRAASDVYEALFFKNAISLLREYDSQHHTNTATVLRHYLENDRKATSVSSMLHLHRNTVLYHIEKIESLLGISLDDSDTRIWLLLAFKADDLDGLCPPAPG